MLIFINLFDPHTADQLSQSKFITKHTLKPCPPKKGNLPNSTNHNTTKSNAAPLLDPS